LIITAASVSKTYATRGLHAPRTEALSNISLEIKQGTCTVIHGPAGSGKSTLLSLLAGISSPTAGEILWNGVRLTRAGDVSLADFRKRCVGYIPQVPALLEDLTLLENVMAPHVFLEIRVGELRDRATDLIERLGLRAKSRFKPSQLSEDEKKMTMTARALAKDPPFLFADEPFTVLNNGSAARVVTLFSELQAKGSAVVAASRTPLSLKPAPSAYKLLDGRMVDIRRGRS
jgi:ABC-type lipoprotein export system ATPase subunit